MTTRGRLTLALGCALYAAAWLLGARICTRSRSAWPPPRSARRSGCGPRARPGRGDAAAGRDLQLEGDDVALELRAELTRGLRPAVALGHRAARPPRRAPDRAYDARPLATGRVTFGASRAAATRFTGATATVQDPFGLARAESPVADGGALLVHPRLVDLAARLHRERDARRGRPAAASAPAERLRLPRRARAPAGRVAAPRALALDGQARRADGQGLRGRAARRARDRPRRRRRPLPGRASTCRCAPPARCCGRSPRAGAPRCSRINRAQPEYHHVASERDWHAAYDVLAAAEPDGRDAARRAARRGGEPARAGRRARRRDGRDAARPRRPARRAASSAAAPAWSSWTPARSPGAARVPTAELLRLSAAGVAVAVAGSGDDLALRPRRPLAPGGCACVGRSSSGCRRPRSWPGAGCGSSSPSPARRASSPLLVLALVPVLPGRALTRGVLAVVRDARRGAPSPPIAVRCARCWNRARRRRCAASTRSRSRSTRTCTREMHALVLFAIFAFALAARARRSLPGGRWRPASCSRRARRGRRRCSAARARSPAACCSSPGACSCSAALGPRTALRPALAAGAAARAGSGRGLGGGGGHSGRRRRLAALEPVHRPGARSASPTSGAASTGASTSRAGRRPCFEVRGAGAGALLARDDARPLRQRRLGRVAHGRLAHPEGDRELLTNDATLPRRADDPAAVDPPAVRRAARSPTTTCPPRRRRSPTRVGARAALLRRRRRLRPGGLQRRRRLHGLELRARAEAAGAGPARRRLPGHRGARARTWRLAATSACPPFGTPGATPRRARVRGRPGGPRLPAALPRPRAGRRQRAHPYGAAVALESWFRSSGGFTLRRAAAAGAAASRRSSTSSADAGRLLPALRRRDGADAALPRLPARVAAGFTSGRWDAGEARGWSPTATRTPGSRSGSRGYGWLPFDPTPSRGTLDAPTRTRRASFDAGAATTAFAGGAAGLGLQALLKLARQHAHGALLTAERPTSQRGGVRVHGSGFAVGARLVAASRSPRRPRLRSCAGEGTPAPARATPRDDPRRRRGRAAGASSRSRRRPGRRRPARREPGRGGRAARGTARRRRRPVRPGRRRGAVRPAGPRRRPPRAQARRELRAFRRRCART